MIIEINEVIALLKELQHSKEQLALTPQGETNTQYFNLGTVQGVKAAISKLENHYGREQY